MCKECLVVGLENFEHIRSRGGGVNREEEILAQRRTEKRVGDWCTFKWKIKGSIKSSLFPMGWEIRFPDNGECGLGV